MWMKLKSILLNSILIEHSPRPNISKPFLTPGGVLLQGVVWLLMKNVCGCTSR